MWALSWLLRLRIEKRKDRFHTRIAVGAEGLDRWFGRKVGGNPGSVIGWDRALPVKRRTAYAQAAAWQRQNRGFADEIRARAGRLAYKHGMGIALDVNRSIHRGRKGAPAD